MRRFFGYESPLAPLAVPEFVARKFERLAAGWVEFNAGAQRRLWGEWVGAGYAEGGEAAALLRSGWMFPNLDRTALYCMLRHVRPRRLLEIGAGESTDVAMHALAANANGRERARCQHTVVEPYRAREVPPPPPLSSF